MDIRKDKFSIGDLVEVVYIGEGTSYFPWAEVPVAGIYMGELEVTHYGDYPNKNVTSFCHKVWAMGKIRYISSIDELKLLSKIGLVNSG